MAEPARSGATPLIASESHMMLLLSEPFVRKHHASAFTYSQSLRRLGGRALLLGSVGQDTMRWILRLSSMIFALSVLGCTYQFGTERPVEIGADGYDGRYDVDNLELRYHVPRSLIGPSYFTFASDGFRDSSDLRIFVSSFRTGNGGVDLGLSPFPTPLATNREVSDYRRFYQDRLAEEGLRATVTSATISGATWIRVEQYYTNGRLARVLFVRPILPAYQLVCRVGLIDDMDPEARSAQWKKWGPAMLELITSVRITDKSKQSNQGARANAHHRTFYAHETPSSIPVSVAHR